MYPCRILRERGPRTAERVADLRAEDVEFYSPLLTKSVSGQRLISRIFAVPSHLRSGRCVLERNLDERSTFLYRKGAVEGNDLEAFELLEGNDGGPNREVLGTLVLEPKLDI